MLATGGHALQKQSHPIQFNLTALNTGWMDDRGARQPTAKKHLGGSLWPVPQRLSQAPAFRPLPPVLRALQMPHGLMLSTHCQWGLERPLPFIGLHLQS